MYKRHPAQYGGRLVLPFPSFGLFMSYNRDNSLLLKLIIDCLGCNS